MNASRFELETMAMGLYRRAWPTKHWHKQEYSVRNEYRIIAHMMLEEAVLLDGIPKPEAKKAAFTPDETTVEVGTMVAPTGPTRRRRAAARLSIEDLPI